jgi:cis-3-alkyl-4-acyloxetan-2-one decarboxylase
MPPVLSHTIEGDESAPTVVMLHGWPDGAALWDAQVRALLPEFRCVRIHLPQGAGAPAGGERGRDFPELAQDIRATIRSVMGHREGARVLLVSHDWGAYLAYLVEAHDPGLVERHVAIDVGPAFRPENVGHALFIVSYQWWLVAAGWIGRALPALGDAMTRSLARLGGAPHAASARASMNYYYAYFWRAFFRPRYRPPFPRPYVPRCPTLFVYGRDKPYRFHGRAWEAALRRSPHCAVAALPGGHWLMVEQAEAVNGLVRGWLKGTGPSRA